MLRATQPTAQPTQKAQNNAIMASSMRMVDQTPAEFEGVALFLRSGDIYTELNNPQMMAAVELSKKIGWRGAVESTFGPREIAYICNENRCKFLDLLPLSKGNTVALEIGCGLGQHTAEIASRVKQLDALDVRLLNLLFTRVRCEQQSQLNVNFACGGDDCRIPYPNDTYDVVILNLVLEWCAKEAAELSAEDGQRLMLSEIRRVLKPGGVLQLNTKNRFSYRLMLGGRDEHCHDMRFGSALPRWLLRRLLSKPPLGHLHSYGALQRLVQSAGLSPFATYWAVPEMRFPEHFVETDAASIRAARPSLFKQSNTRATNLLMKVTPARLVRYFTPGLFLIARK